MPLRSQILPVHTEHHSRPKSTPTLNTFLPSSLDQNMFGLSPCALAIDLSVIQTIDSILIGRLVGATCAVIITHFIFGSKREMLRRHNSSSDGERSDDDVERGFADDHEAYVRLGSESPEGEPGKIVVPRTRDA